MWLPLKEGLDSEKSSTRITDNYFSKEKSYSNSQTRANGNSRKAQNRLLLSEKHRIQNEHKYISDLATNADYQIDNENAVLQMHTDRMVYNSTNCSLCHSYNSNYTETDQ